MKFLSQIVVFFYLYLVVCGIEIQTITDANIDSTVGDGHGNWLLLFYLDTCPHCKDALSVLNSLSTNSELDSENFILENLQIGKIECSSNNWSCMRFNITRVPYIIALQNDKLFEYQSYATEQRLLNFLKEEKLAENSLNIPPILGYLSILSKVYEEAIRVLNEQMQTLVHTYVGLNFTWSTNHTIAMLILMLAMIIFIEYMIVFYFCGRKKNKTVQTKSNLPSDQVKVEEDKPKTE